MRERPRAVPTLVGAHTGWRPHWSAAEGPSPLPGPPASLAHPAAGSSKHGPPAFPPTGSHGLGLPGTPACRLDPGALSSLYPGPGLPAPRASVG